jgi:hypothetical protein
MPDAPNRSIHSPRRQTGIASAESVGEKIVVVL